MAQGLEFRASGSGLKGGFRVGSHSGSGLGAGLGAAPQRPALALQRSCDHIDHRILQLT